MWPKYGCLKNREYANPAILTGAHRGFKALVASKAVTTSMNEADDVQ
jgi:hypothetical protein